MQRVVQLDANMPPVGRLGLATRGNTHLKADDVLYAIDRGITFLNWCAHPDGMSEAIRGLDAERRKKSVVCAQFMARTSDEAWRELEEMLHELGTEWIDVLTFYYIEQENEWEQIAGRGGALEALLEAKRCGSVKLVGLTTHQRELAARRARNHDLDILMIRYNAAHRGAEKEVFPITDKKNIPVIAFTGLRWGALLEPTADDPPNFIPPTAQDCYRFVLSNPSVSIALMAPDDRVELEANLALLDDWHSMSSEEMQRMRVHGDRVYRTAGGFP